MRYLALIAMFLFAGSVSAVQCTTLHNGKTLSGWASEGRVGPVKHLVRNHCNVNATTPDETALQAAIKSSQSGAIEVIGWVANREDVDIELRDSSDLTPLMLAAKHDNVSAVAVLVAAGAAINAKNDSGKTALHYARTPEMFISLIDFGANVNATDTMGQTPLHVVAEHLNEGYIVDLLIEKGAKTTIDHFAITSSGSLSPLMVAAMQDKPSAILRRLVALGANVDATEVPGAGTMTAMHYAARHGHIDNVRELIKAGANVNQGITHREREYPMISAFFGAKTINRTEVIKELIAAGGRIVNDHGTLRPIVDENHIDKTILESILKNPKPYWPVRAHAMGMFFRENYRERSVLEIDCHENSDDCHVYFNCTSDEDTDGAKTGNTTIPAGMLESHPSWASSSGTVSAVLGIGYTGWTGLMDCALHSQQRITAQYWAITKTALVNNINYTRSDENNRTILQRIHPGGALTKMTLRIRCIGEGDCTNTALQCRTGTGSKSIDVGKIDRLKTTTLYNYARGDDESDIPTDILTCNVKSDDAFLVQILVRSGGELVNHTGVSME